MIDILSLSLEELQEEIAKINEAAFRAKQIFDWLHVKRAVSFSEMSNLSEQFRLKLAEHFCIKRLNIEKKLVSRHDYTVKYLYELPDFQNIETVLMKYKHANSLCVSTQAGCKMNCAFCASGANGFVRNLEPSEMLLQLYETERNSDMQVGSLVLMGIGEPLDNFNNVIKFLRLLSDKNGRNMSLRHVSLSTCGLADKIDELAELRPGLTLSVSLHAADDETRSKIMPVNNKFNIASLLKSCKSYYEKTGRRVSFEYALIKDVNDSLETAEKLAKLIKPLHAHLNLIPVNPTGHALRAPANIKYFYERLVQSGINVTVRRTLGADINAACGQLRAESTESSLKMTKCN
ncbi:MAG: 23S rRNA (adenine(2503)-C(2))-methyltransferase RlmN [Oscillospiraceae bacterium]|jgi:23S rRNA (adenine2503-C2)-methyltransferase|nr:23S rRNA (adenine(2503)-C(2))-methyltransferase RlmN [Oscillospiraceae bacterium]